MARPAASARWADSGGVSRVARRPVGVVLGDHLGKVAAPHFDQFAVGLEMKLDAVDGPADAECLDSRSCSLVGEMLGAGRQREGVGMPVKNGTSSAERGDERIAPSRPRSAALPASRTRSAGRGCFSRRGRGRRAGRRGRCRARPCRPRRTAGSARRAPADRDGRHRRRRSARRRGRRGRHSRHGSPESARRDAPGEASISAPASPSACPTTPGGVAG